MSMTSFCRGGPPTPPLTPAALRGDPDAWAARTLCALYPRGALPTRPVIDAIMAAAIPPIGTPTAVYWGGRRKEGALWWGRVDGQYSGGFTILVHPGHYRKFVSYVDLWCRHAEIEEPLPAAGRIRALRMVLIPRISMSARSDA